jgi:hypothetical protein
MSRTVTALLLAGLLLPAGLLRSQDAPAGAAGTWKVGIPIQGATLTMLFKLQEKDGKWAGEFLGAAPPLRATPAIQDVSVSGDRIRFTIQLGTQGLSFDGKLPAEKGGKAHGTLSLGGDLLLTELIPSQLKNLTDSFELALETAKQTEGGREMFDAVFDVLAQAAGKKVPADDLRTLAAKANKAAEPYGPRWQRTVALRLSQALLNIDGQAPAALQQARRAERLLDASDSPGDQLPVYEALAAALAKAGQGDEAKEVRGRLAKLEQRDFQEYEKKLHLFKPEPFPGRKATSDRAVLVELFTGSECPPCVAADLGFEALGQAYKPTEVILLQYHLHIPRPDPMVNADAEARAGYYGNEIEGTPTVLFDGKPPPEAVGGGGPATAAQSKFDQYRKVIDPLLEKPASGKLQARASRKGNVVTINAKAAEVKGGKVSLRLALTEERVRFAGGNGMRYHYHVVRAMPGGPAGTPVVNGAAEATGTVNLDELRTKLERYLTEFSEKNEYRFSDRPMALNNLRAVAFLQDDATKEVLQAVQVELGGEGGKE